MSAIPRTPSSAPTLSPQVIQEMGFPATQSDEYPSQRLHQAVSEQNVFEIRNALDPTDPTTTGVNIDAKDAWQRTPLAVASKRGSAVIVAYLLARGANPTIKSRFGDSPLGTAIANQHFDVAARSPASRSPVATSLGWAGCNNHLDVVRILVSLSRVHIPFSNEPNYQRNMLGETILHTAVRTSNKEMIKLLLSFATFNDLNAKNDVDQTVREVASAEALEVLQEYSNYTFRTEMSFDDLIRAGDLWSLSRKTQNTACTAANEDGFTPLHVAAEVGDASAAAVLLYSSASNLNTRDRVGKTPLLTAALNGHISVVLLLLGHNAGGFCTADNDFGRNLNGESVFHAAARAGSPEIVRVLAAFEPFNEQLELENNQGQKPPALSEDPTVAVAFAESMRIEAHMHDLPTPLPLSPAPRVVCAVCLTSPPTDQDSVVYACECMAPFCEDCFIHLAQSSINSGAYPVCCNAVCDLRVPFETLSRLLPISQQLTLVSLLVNEKQQIENVYKHSCPVCNRINDLEPALLNQEPRYNCNHCGVFLCAVCSNIYPQSSTGNYDDTIHANCGEKFGSLKLFIEFHDMLKWRVQRFCPSCLKGGQKDDACTHMSCCARWCYVCGCTGEAVEQDDIGTHGNYDGAWRTNTTMCPMYCNHLAIVDPRVAALGCDDANCRPNGSCNVNTCAQVRDRFAQALLTTIRVRLHILEFIERMGKRAWVDMITQFGWRDTIDSNYFNNSFDWDSDDVPHWSDFEPEEVRPFYLERERWFNPTPRIAAPEGEPAEPAAAAPPPPPMPGVPAPPPMPGNPPMNPRAGLAFNMAPQRGMPPPPPVR